MKTRPQNIEMTFTFSTTSTNQKKTKQNKQTKKITLTRERKS